MSFWIICIFVCFLITTFVIFTLIRSSVNIFCTLICSLLRGNRSFSFFFFQSEILFFCNLSSLRFTRLFYIIFINSIRDNIRISYSTIIIIFYITITVRVYIAFMNIRIYNSLLVLSICSIVSIAFFNNNIMSILTLSIITLIIILVNNFIGINILIAISINRFFTTWISIPFI